MCLVAVVVMLPEDVAARAPVMLVVPERVRSLDAPVIVALRLPVPEMSLEMVVEAARTKFKLALLERVAAPVPMLPFVPAAPTCKVPLEMLVPPEYVLLLLSVSLPVPDLSNAPAPEIAALIVIPLSDRLVTNLELAAILMLVAVKSGVVADVMALPSPICRMPALILSVPVLNLFLNKTLPPPDSVVVVAPTMP